MKVYPKQLTGTKKNILQKISLDLQSKKLNEKISNLYSIN